MSTRFSFRRGLSAIAKAIRTGLSSLAEMLLDTPNSSQPENLSDGPVELIYSLIDAGACFVVVNLSIEHCDINGTLTSTTSLTFPLCSALDTRRASFLQSALHGTFYAINELGFHKHSGLTFGNGDTNLAFISEVTPMTKLERLCSSLFFDMLQERDRELRIKSDDEGGADFVRTLRGHSVFANFSLASYVIDRSCDRDYLSPWANAFPAQDGIQPSCLFKDWCEMLPESMPAHWAPIPQECPEETA